MVCIPFVVVFIIKYYAIQAYTLQYDETYRIALSIVSAFSYPTFNVVKHSLCSL